MNKKIASEIAIGIILLLAIIIGGVFYWQSKQVPAVSNQQPVINNQQSQQPEQQIVTNRIPVDTTNSYDTSKWLTYTNEKYRYSFKYPNVGWILNGGNSDSDGILGEDKMNQLKNADVIEVVPKNSPYAGSSINIGPQEKPDLKTEDYNDDNEKGRIISYATFLGLDAVQVVSHAEHLNDPIYPDQADNIEIYFNKNGYTFELQGRTKDYNKFDNIDTGIFNAVLSTFKFTDSAVDETANWQTYTNVALGFSFRYPDKKLIIGKIDSSCKNNCSMLIDPKDPKGSTEVAGNLMDFYIERNQDKGYGKDGVAGYAKDNNYVELNSSNNVTWYCVKNRSPESASVSMKECMTVKNSDVYRMGGYFSDKSDYFTENEFDQIIDSFEFTN
jgi:uncharacterized protein YxeA